MQHLLLAFSVAAVIASAPAPSSEPSVCQDEVIIVILNRPDTADPGGHRGQDQLTISGYVDTVLDMVFLSFSVPCGDVDIAFDNLTTGESMETAVNGNGTVAIPAAFSPGSWRVTVTLTNGDSFIGYFVI